MKLPKFTSTQLRMQPDQFCANLNRLLAEVNNYSYSRKTSSSSYALPVATSTKLGGVKVGSGLSITRSGTLSATGGQGTSNYDTLSNRPQINDVTLTGNKDLSALNVNYLTNWDIENLIQW